MPYADVNQQREYQRNWKAKRRAEYLADKCCAKCGSRDRLEIDHKDPSKKLSHKIWTWSKERREAELAKCQVLCHKHHREKTSEETRTAIHGSSRMYGRYGCRCDLCKAWKVESNRQHRERHPK
jgi:hypothetical protein